MPAVDVYSWNPPRPIVPGKIGWKLPLKRRVRNFGDLLGPIVVAAMRERTGATGPAVREAQLMSIGSVVHFAGDGAVVWGTGVNAKIEEYEYTAATLDVRAVRGPRTRAFLMARGFEVPEIFGDPAQLLPLLHPEVAADRPTHDLTFVPNVNDRARPAPDRVTLDPRRPVWECVRRLAASELVVGSSLHAVIVAEAFGRPARLIAPEAESAFKYEDYYLATGRPGVIAARSFEEAVALGGEAPPAWDPAPLLDAFPADLWHPGRGRG